MIAEHSYKVLLVSSSEKFNFSVLPLLSDTNGYCVSTVTNGSAARRCILEEKFDIVLINTPLTDEFGTKMALDITADSNIGVMLFVKAEHFPETNARVSPFGILTISKPTSLALVSQSLTILCATRERLRRMEQKSASIEEKMEEIRLVNRAKWVLIENLKMTEPEAHRYIEKTAMDTCKPKREIAESVIKTYN